LTCAWGRVERDSGDPARETVHGDDPVAVAARWWTRAQWLHVVNLDGRSARRAGARRAGGNRALGAGAFGGGLRSLDDAGGA